VRARRDVHPIESPWKGRKKLPFLKLLDFSKRKQKNKKTKKNLKKKAGKEKAQRKRKRRKQNTFFLGFSLEVFVYMFRKTPFEGTQDEKATRK
jgi:hypothetical protein